MNDFTFGYLFLFEKKNVPALYIIIIVKQKKIWLIKYFRKITLKTDFHIELTSDIIILFCCLNTFLKCYFVKAFDDDAN